MIIDSFLLSQEVSRNPEAWRDRYRRRRTGETIVANRSACQGSGLLVMAAQDAIDVKGKEYGSV